MNKIKAYLSCFLLGAVVLPATVMAQKENKDKDKEKEKDIQEIVITRKGEKSNKVIVEIVGDKVTVNGKPVDQYKDGDVTVDTHKYKGWGAMTRTPGRSFTISGDGDSFFSEDNNRAMLGVVTDKEDEGAIISEITKESGAEKAGLKEGDIITKLDDKKIEDPDDLTKAVRDHKPGDKVTVTFLRDKKEQKVTAELSKWKGMKFNSWGGNGKSFNFSMPEIAPVPEVSPRIHITPYSGDSYGVWDAYNGHPKLGLSVQDSEDGKGVKVIDVDDESNAEKAGIKEDDIITSINDKEVNGADEVAKIVRENKDKISMKFKIIRDGKTQDIDVKVPRKLKTADL
ncbi:MAG: PDZ domain-containing protein [Chitinophagaceae bacterium]